MTLPTPTPMPTPTPTPMPMPMPRPFRVALGALVLLLGATAGLAGKRAAAQRPSTQDVTNVETLLGAMRGAGPIPCGLALGVVEGNGWGNWSGRTMSGIDSATDGIRVWLGEGITDPAVVPTLRTALGSADACERQVAARLLGRTHNAAALRALTEASRAPEATTRELAAVGLGFSDSPSAYEPLVATLRDSAPGVRAASAMALGQLEERRATALLVTALANDRAPEVRRAAAVALGRMD